MIEGLLSFLVALALLALIVWVIETYFPAIPPIIRAVIIAGLILAGIRALHLWVCGWLCAP